MVFGISLTVILTWLACHFFGDFAFQSTWMSTHKGKSWEVSFYHCATYTSVFIIFAHPSLVALGILIGTHFVIDTLKSRYKIIRPIWLDQLLHVLVIVGILFFKL